MRDLDPLVWLVLTLAVVAVIGALMGSCAMAHAGNVRRQTVRLPVSCYAYEADDDPEGPPIQVFAPANREYRLVTLLAGVTTTLATLPCSELPRVVTIGGAWPAGSVLGCVLDVCTPAR